MKKMTKLEELHALDATLDLLEFWAWRAQQEGETAKAQGYSRGHAVFEENKQGLLWSLSNAELKEYEAAKKSRKTATKAPPAKAVSKKKSKKR